MDIYLSINNRADILQIPVLPAEYTISKPQGLQTFETVSKGDLQFIGTPKLSNMFISCSLIQKPCYIRLHYEPNMTGL